MSLLFYAVNVVIVVFNAYTYYKDRDCWMLCNVYYYNELIYFAIFFIDGLYVDDNDIPFL